MRSIVQSEVSPLETGLTRRASPAVPSNYSTSVPLVFHYPYRSLFIPELFVIVIIYSLPILPYTLRVYYSGISISVSITSPGSRG